LCGRRHLRTPPAGTPTAAGSASWTPNWPPPTGSATAPLAGRPSKAAADAERVRVNVTRTIRAAIDRIIAAAPIAGAHLQASIRTGIAYRYQPAAGGPARWHT